MRRNSDTGTQGHRETAEERRRKASETRAQVPQMSSSFFSSCSLVVHVTENRRNEVNGASGFPVDSSSIMKKQKNKKKEEEEERSMKNALS